VRSRTPPHRWFLPLHWWPWRVFPGCLKLRCGLSPCPACDRCTWA
jgi:hypothetical protein